MYKQEMTGIVRLVTCSKCKELALDCKGYPASVRIDANADGRVHIELPRKLDFYPTDHENWFELLCDKCAPKPLVDCPVCDGGRNPKWCPTCNNYARSAGTRCLDCDTEHVVCPECGGEGRVRSEYPRKYVDETLLPKVFQQLTSLDRVGSRARVMRELEDLAEYATDLKKHNEEMAKYFKKVDPRYAY